VINCNCYDICKHEPSVKIELNIPESMYKVLQYRQTRDEYRYSQEIESIEDDILQLIRHEDFFSMDYDEWLREQDKK